MYVEECVSVGEGVWVTAAECFNYSSLQKSFEPRLFIFCLAPSFHLAKSLPGAGRAKRDWGANEAGDD